MELIFEVRSAYGQSRYYPANEAAAALVYLTQRKCLKDYEVMRLQHAGFTVRTQTKEAAHAAD